MVKIGLQLSLRISPSAGFLSVPCANFLTLSHGYADNRPVSRAECGQRRTSSTERSTSVNPLSVVSTTVASLAHVIPRTATSDPL